MTKTEDELKREKLELEIADLKTSPWRKPGTIIPILATLGTIAFAQYLGVFEVERKELDVKTRELKLQEANLSTVVDSLKIARTKVEFDTRQLEKDKAEVAAELNRSRLALTTLQNELQQAEARLGEAQARNERTYPSFRARVIERFVANARAQCRGARASPGSIEFLTGKASSEPADAMEQAFFDPASCLSALLQSQGDIQLLKAGDLAQFTQDVNDLGEKLTELRAEAVRTYSSVSFLSTNDALKRINTEPERQAEKAPPTEPQRAEWINAIRKVRVRETLNRQVATAMSGLLNRFQTPPVAAPP